MTQSQTYGAKNERWDLSDLFSGLNDPKIKKIMTTATKEAVAFEKSYKGKLKSLTSAQLAKAFQQLEALLTPLYKLSQYSHLVYSTDTSLDAAKRLIVQIDELESKISNTTMFFHLELAKLSKATIEKLAKSKECKNYSYSIQRAYETAQYNLTEAEERIANLKNLTGVNAFKQLYSDLTNTFQYEFKIDGKIRKMNGSELRALRQHPDKKVRRQAMKTFYERYEENSLTITHIFNQVLKNLEIERELRGYKRAISIKNIGNDLPDKAVDALHEVTHESYRLVHRYYELKKKILKLPDMTLADIYAPMPSGSETILYKDAKEIVLEGFSQFDKEFYKCAKLMFDQQRIDAPVGPKKRGGAYCSSSTPDLKPFVMLNYLGRDRDVATMAHELGHAIHAMLSEKQTLFNYHSILPLAETASVFSEMIVTDMLLRTKTDKLSKQALLTTKLEDIFATSHRQNMFSNFEQETHGRIGKGILTTDEYCDIYKGALKQMFGKSVAQPDEYKWEWSTIPHMIESPFYVYAYNFGNLLVMALYQQYLEEGKTFVPKLKQMLAAGSSMRPVEIAAIVGADINKPQFWRKSLAYIESLLVQLESL